MRTFFKKYSFFIKAGTFYLLWWFIYHHLQAKTGFFDRFVIDWQTRLAAYLLELADYPVLLALDDSGYYNRLWIDGSTLSLEVASNCNAMELVGIFSIFIVAYPSTWKQKSILLPGICVLFLCNIIRIAALVLIEFKAPEYMQVNHKYVFTSAIYLLIAGIWWVWLEKIREKTP